MAYLVTRSLSFGTYTPPRQARRRPVRFAGHYGLGQTTQAESFCQSASVRIPMVLRAKWLQACITAYQQQHPAAAAAPAQAPIAAPIATPGPTPIAAPIAAPISAPIVTTADGSAAVSTAAYAGTPVPVGFPMSQIYVDGQGNQWMFDPSSGTWKNATQLAKNAAITSEQQQAAQIAAATATSPAGGPAPILVTSPTISPSLQQPSSLSPVSVNVSSGGGYSDILNWLTESTLISPVPNWILVAGAGLVVFKLSGKGHLL